MSSTPLESNLPRKKAITEARREQNRRAQRAFRERHRPKPISRPIPTPRQLAPRPLEDGADVAARPFDTDTGDLAQDVSSQGNPTPNSSDPGSTDGPQEQQTPSAYITKEARFTFSSPQTLFPAHESLVPKRNTPSSEFLEFARDPPRAALWPHGVTATLAACLYNARALGIDIDRIMDKHYMSPFYQPTVSLMLAPGSTVRPTDIDAASDLQLAVLGSARPCFAQVIFPHHACIDLLPLPRLRETAVMLTVRAQQEDGGVMSSMFDGVQELKKDVYVRQGVRFRGTGELKGEEYILYDESGRHCGHPWESGSWAVSPWFARKWNYVVDI